MTTDSPRPDAIFAPRNLPAHPLTRVFFGSQGLRAGWRLLCYVFLAAVLGLLLPRLASYLWANPPRGLNPGYMLTQECLAAGVVFGGALVMSFLEGRAMGVYGLPLSGVLVRRLAQGTFWGLAEVGVLMLLIAAWGGYSFGNSVLHGAAMIHSAVLWAIVFIVVGLFEEFAFRGYTQFTLASGIGFWPAAFVLSAIFGGIHISNPGEGWIGASGAGLIGLFYCLTLRRTGSLWFAVGAHAAFDWGETFLFSVPNSGIVAEGHLSGASLHGPRWLTGGTVGPEGSIFCFLITALMFVGFYFVFPATSSPAQAASTNEPAPH